MMANRLLNQPTIQCNNNASAYVTTSSSNHSVSVDAHKEDSSIDHDMIPPYLEDDSAASRPSESPASMASSSNQSKENLHDYLLLGKMLLNRKDERAADYIDDSTQSSISLSSNQSNNAGLVRSKTRHIFSNSEQSLDVDVLTGRHHQLGDHHQDEKEESIADYRNDSSHFISLANSHSKTSPTNPLIRVKSREIFTTTEKFQSHPDLKALADEEEKMQGPPIQISTGGRHIIPTKYFGRDINSYTHASPDAPTFDKDLRNFMETHINKARKSRDEKKETILKTIGAELHKNSSLPRASRNAYVPYPSLRIERPFLFDVETYPLHRILADALGVSDLSLIHEHPTQNKRKLLSPLLDAKNRRAFHTCYDNFVTSFCIPLLHSLAMVDNLFHDSRNSNQSQKISYRYQAFPCIRVNRPGEFSIGPHCDMAYGHSMGNINFHIPLTPTFGTNALYTESHPGREDWHPLKTKSVGLGYCFDGARCLHFTLENSTQRSRVSLDFRVAIHRESGLQQTPNNAHPMMEHNIMPRQGTGSENSNNYDVNDLLCGELMLRDNYSTFPGYYEEAVVDLGTSPSTNKHFGPGPIVNKRNRKGLMQPDKRVGFPF